MLHVASVCTTCCMLLRDVGRCFAKFETGQTLTSATSKRTQQLPTLLGKKCWELLRPFALSLTLFSWNRTCIERLKFWNKIWGSPYSSIGAEATYICCGSSILGLNFISLCFNLNIIPSYHIQKHRETKFKSRIKLNHNISNPITAKIPNHINILAIR